MKRDYREDFPLLMQNETAYLDNAATTKPSKAAVDAMIKAAECFGNPSSLHGLGIEAEKLINESKKNIADMLGVESKNILFTSGGTEANNLTVFGVVAARHKIGTKIVTSKIEHPSVLEAFRKLEIDGFNVEYLDVDSEGRVDLDMLRNVLDDETILISVMHVNNETGVIQPIEEIREIMLEKAPYAHLHTDCVQSFGKIDVKPKKMGADLVTISSHKIHGFKGTGALYVADTRMIRPILFGGEQQGEIRPGTENVGGILAFGAAAAECDTDQSKLIHLRNTMKEKLQEIPNIKINGSDEYNSGSVLNVSFIGIKAEILLHSLEAHKIYVSTGSACSSHKPQPSHVLTAMGLDKKEINGAVRISFDRLTEEEDVIKAAEIIAKRWNCAVLSKGGHSEQNADDFLYEKAFKCPKKVWYPACRIDNPNTHGTGCTLSSAIAANLAKGFSIEESVKEAKDYISGAIGAMLNLGQGNGPLDHMWDL